MMEMTLAILAAGTGIRCGVGVKQLDPVGPGGELNIDCSVYVAVLAGFDRIVFIIRHDIYDDFLQRSDTRYLFCASGWIFDQYP